MGTSRATDVGPGSRTDNSTGIARGGARPAGRPRWLGVCPPFIFRCVTIHPSVVPEHSGARGGSSCFTVRHPFEMTRGLRPRTSLHHPAGGHTASVHPPIIVSVLVVHKPREEEDLLRPAMQTRPERQTCFAPCRAQRKYLPLLSEGQHSLHNVTRRVGGRVPVSRSFSGALEADESWPSSGLLAAQRKGKSSLSFCCSCRSVSRRHNVERQVPRSDLGVEDKERLFQLRSDQKGTAQSRSWQQVSEGRKCKP